MEYNSTQYKRSKSNSNEFSTNKIRNNNLKMFIKRKTFDMIQF